MVKPFSVQRPKVSSKGVATALRNNDAWQQLAGGGGGSSGGGDGVALGTSIVGEELASPPTTSQQVGAGSIQGRYIHIVGGTTNRERHYQYDLDTDSWVRLTDALDEPYPYGVGVDDSFYIFYRNALLRWNPDGSYTTLASPSVSSTSGFCYDGEDTLYAVSGADVYSYSLTDDSWSSLGSTSASVANGSAVIRGDNLYILGNFSSLANSRTTIIEFNVTNGTSREITHPFGWGSGGTAGVTKVLAVPLSGGKILWGGQQELWAYDPSDDSFENLTSTIDTTAVTSSFDFHSAGSSTPHVDNSLCIAKSGYAVKFTFL